VGALAALAAPGAALAAPDCPPPLPQPQYLLRDQTRLESVIVDARGRLFFTDAAGLLRLDARGAQPVRLVDVEAPGGLAFDTDGKLMLGSGNSIANGSHGDADGPSSLVEVDPDTGASSVYATGLSMGNGIVRGPDGSFYASNDIGSNIDRIRDGQTERGWAKVESGNGLVIESTGRYLYAAQTFRPAAIARVDLAAPADVTTYMAADQPDWEAGLDGLAIDAADNVFAAANKAGEIWKIGPKADGTAARPCVLLRGLPGFPDGPSAVAVGAGSGPFGAGNLYVVTFDGNVIELPGVAVPPGSVPTPPLRLRIRPKSARVGVRTRFRVRTTATVAGKVVPVAGALVRLAGHRRRTGARGRTSIVATLRRTGRVRARATRRGFRPAKAWIRARASG
jgi:sugar lactone lactonase YvrE